ncbi:membrane protein [Microbacterium phage HerculesXL]|nr:membrane protein [Microbacterium phage HerculesXL]
MSDQPHPPVPAVQVEVPVRQARDRAQYVRQQKGHSFILHWLVLGVFTVFIVPIYYSVSPNHYWHL